MIRPTRTHDTIVHEESLCLSQLFVSSATPLIEAAGRKMAGDQTRPDQRKRQRAGSGHRNEHTTLPFLQVARGGVSGANGARGPGEDKRRCQ